MLVDSPEVEATRSEGPPDSNAERKRSLTDPCSHESSEARTSPQRVRRKKSRKRAKSSEQGEEGGVGISPHARTQASVEVPPRGSQHGESSTVPYNYFEPIIFNVFMSILTIFSSSHSSIKLV
jgi:hypothetical protein